MTSKPALSTLTRLSSQIHISPNPPPKTLAESRQIFAALQGFGEIISFRNLKYDIRNDTDRERPLIAMFDSSEAAERAIAASPLTITLPTPTPPAFTPNPFASSSSSSTLSPSPSTSTSTPTPPTITCTLNPSRHNYERSTRRNPFYSMFTIDKESAIYADMRSEETDTPLAELADVLMRTKSVTFASQRYGARVNAQRIGADSLMRIWERGRRRGRGRGRKLRDKGKGSRRRGVGGGRRDEDEQEWWVGRDRVFLMEVGVAGDSWRSWGRGL
ncbi:uncharacterized protein N7496_009607 [Penicillium cataractarum]|uniref:RRM domain-containing protein n=1 Tax=Penicillium cataractarum TaxID=2100454 RepID=A0A9W9V150_9EURO|nr:uncharacterized protein N7496_009607 [Penicillium cataractarum]KAJ5363894.1 hypothetical protein N7496_009607 [Penicillium cataractarum]